MAEKGQTKKVNLGWHRDRKENPISAPSIHVGALVGAGSLWPCKPGFEKKINKKHKKDRGKLFAFISHTIILYNLEQVHRQH